MKWKSHFRFNKQERSGIFFLLLIIVLLQIGYFFYRRISRYASEDTLIVDRELQIQIDSLKEVALQEDSFKIYPFNPNFITDYKGYTLGMSVDEIDRLHNYRKKNKFANTPEEFQKVTQVSDTLLASISPHFKFPEWTKKSKQSSVNSKRPASKKDITIKKSFPLKGPLGEVSDLNTATVQELRTISGIGEKLSTRIIKFRDRLGGFLIDDQLYDVYGLEPEVIEKTLKRFKVLQKPNIQKININTATAYKIATLIYIRRQVAERIVEYRYAHGSFDSFEELENIEDFPSDKIHRIALYLSL